MDPNWSAASVLKSIEVFNDTGEEIVLTSFRKDDSMQAIAFDKINLSDNRNGFAEEGKVLKLPEEYSHMHVHRLGLFRLISPRTRLSSGFGFTVHEGERYWVRLIQPDEKSNLCSLFTKTPEGEFTKVESPRPYQFGDVLIKPSLKCLGVLEKSNDNYQFGDILIRPLLRYVGFIPQLPNLQLDDSIFREYIARQNDINNQNMSEMIATNSVIPHAHIDEREIWGIFFVQVHDAGLWACDTNLVPIDDIEAFEPYLFIGLPALALFNTVARSLVDPAGLVLKDTRRVLDSNCPPNFRQLFELLLTTKGLLNEITPLDANDKSWIRQLLIFSDSDRIIPSGITEDRRVELCRALSHLVSVCSQLTQQPYFKENFLDVLNHIKSSVQTRGDNRMNTSSFFEEDSSITVTGNSS